MWSKLPGSSKAKALEMCALFVVFTLFMFMYGFPFLEHILGIDQTTMTP